MWQAWLAATYGPEVAEAVGRAHERMASDAADSAVDRENNRIGQEYGVAHAERIRAERDAARPVGAGRRGGPPLGRGSAAVRRRTTASGGGT